MSNHLYLLCLDHTPHISSWHRGEVGNHLSDLPDVQGYIANRDALLQAHEMDAQPEARWARTAMYFFAEHPKCNIGIQDEYGQYHPAVAGSIVSHNHPIVQRGGRCNIGCVTFPPARPVSFMNRGG